MLLVVLVTLTRVKCYRRVGLGMNCDLARRKIDKDQNGLKFSKKEQIDLVSYS